MIDHKDVAAWKAHLEQYGYVVLTSILDADGIEDGITLFESLGQVEVTDMGLTIGSRYAHSEFAWYSRTRPTVKKVFEELYDSDELVCSMDCASYHTPYGDQDTAYWLHLDYPMGQDNIPIKTYQASLNYLDISHPSSPGLRVVPRSHQWYDMLHQDYQVYGDKSADAGVHYQLSQPLMDLVVDQWQCVTQVNAPAGSLTLWDSKLIHDGTPATDQEHASRISMMLSYMPLAAASDDDLAERRLIYQRGETTTHYPLFHINTVHYGEGVDTNWVWQPDLMIARYPDIRNLIPLPQKKRKSI